MLFIKNIVLCLGILLTANISSVSSAIPDESLEPESKVLIVHDYSFLSREHIEKNGLDSPYGKLYFEFIPGITKENIPENHVAIETSLQKTFVYNGSLLEGVLPRRFKNYYNMSCMLLSTYIEKQALAARIRRNNLSSELQVLPNETLIFDPITAYPIVVSKNDERVLKNHNYRFQPPKNLNSTEFEPHHFIYRPTITFRERFLPNELIFPAVKSSSSGRNIFGTHPTTCRQYSTYIRALRRFL